MLSGSHNQDVQPLGQADLVAGWPLNKLCSRLSLARRSLWLRDRLLLPMNVLALYRPVLSPQSDTSQGTLNMFSCMASMDAILLCSLPTQHGPSFLTTHRYLGTTHSFRTDTHYTRSKRRNIDLLCHQQSNFELGSDFRQFPVPSQSPAIRVLLYKVPSIVYNIRQTMGDL